MQELCERWSAGDDLAGEALFREARPVLESFLFSKVLEADIVQRVFMVLFEVRARFHVDAPPALRVAMFPAYMFGVARKKVLEYIRVRRHSAQFDPAEVSLAAAHPSLSGQVSARRHLEHLHTTLHQLPLDQQIAFELREFQELSYPEIAAALEIPEGTAKSRVRLARKVLSEDFGIKFRRPE